MYRDGPVRLGVERHEQGPEQLPGRVRKPVPDVAPEGAHLVGARDRVGLERKNRIEEGTQTTLDNMVALTRTEANICSRTRFKIDWTTFLLRTCPPPQPSRCCLLPLTQCQILDKIGPASIVNVTQAYKIPSQFLCHSSHYHSQNKS